MRLSRHINPDQVLHSTMKNIDATNRRRKDRLHTMPQKFQSERLYINTIRNRRHTTSTPGLIALQCYVALGRALSLQ